MQRVAVVFAFAMCACMSPVMHFGAGSSPEEAQEKTLGKLMPPQLAAERTWTGEVTTQKIRVYADDDFRAQNVHWRQTFAEELEYANAVLRPMLGIVLVAEYQDWPRHAQGGSLPDAIEALAQLDPGSDVMSVVGLTSALSLVSEKFELLGYASTPGRYLVLRGYADLDERKVFARALRDLEPAERENLHEARRRHKTAAVLLHELGHNLGAPHEAEADTIMAAQYSDHAAAFSESSRAIMLATVDARLGRRRVEAVVEASHGWIAIAVSASGEASSDGKPMDGDALDRLFAAAFARDPATQVVITYARGGSRVPVVKVMERAKAAGLTRLAAGTGQ